MGLQGYTLYFLFLLKNIYSGYSLEPPRPSVCYAVGYMSSFSLFQLNVCMYVCMCAQNIDCGYSLEPPHRMYVCMYVCMYAAGSIFTNFTHLCQWTLLPYLKEPSKHST